MAGSGCVRRKHRAKPMRAHRIQPKRPFQVPSLQRGTWETKAWGSAFGLNRIPPPEGSSDCGRFFEFGSRRRSALEPGDTSVSWLDRVPNELRVSRERFQGCVHRAVYRNGLHAAEVYWAMPQEARGTRSLSQQEVVAWIAG